MAMDDDGGGGGGGDDAKHKNGDHGDREDEGKGGKELTGKMGFEWAEIRGAGHFWREEGVEQEMRRKVGEWIDRLLRGQCLPASNP